jgi:hypothetical protein
MTVTNLGEDPAGRSARNTKGVRTYSRRWKVSTSLITENEYHVGSASGLPLIGDTHPSDALAWCVSLDVQCPNPWKGWTVTAEYSSEFQLSVTPTSDPAIITWGTEQFQKPAEYDNDFNAITNSAGDGFDPPYMMDDSRRVATIQKNVAVSPSWLLDYQDAVNSDAFNIGDVAILAGQAKMQAVSIGPAERRNNTLFYPLSFTISIQRDKWKLEPLDMGFRYKDGNDRKVIVNDDGTIPTAPVLLNGAGGVLMNPSSASAVFLSYNIYKTRAFSSLPLT